jgi:T-complex protein 1 subunit beta
LLWQVAEIEGAEKGKMKDKVDKIIGHGINCFINRQLIYNYPEQLFADAGVMAIGAPSIDCLLSVATRQRACTRVMHA